MKYRRMKFFKFAYQSPEHQRIPAAAFIETANFNILCGQFCGECSARIKRNDRDIKPIFTQTRNQGCHLPFSAAGVKRANEEDNLDHKEVDLSGLRFGCVRFRATQITYGEVNLFGGIGRTISSAIQIARDSWVNRANPALLAKPLSEFRATPFRLMTPKFVLMKYSQARTSRPPFSCAVASALLSSGTCTSNTGRLATR